jgi:shikimate kinase
MEDKMTRIAEHQSEGTKKNVILVGVAGVGKTTLGKLAAKRLGMSFVDVDMEFEDTESSDIDTLLERYGEDEFDKRLLNYFSEIINRNNNTVFAAPARITHYKRFWEVVKKNGVSIHLQGEPMEVYMRQDMLVMGRKLTEKDKLKKHYKRMFYDYYWWRLRHCQKADYMLRIVGNKQTDTENLCKKITEIIPIDISEKDGVQNL